MIFFGQKQIFLLAKTNVVKKIKIFKKFPASDGLWDNVPEEQIAELLTDVEPHMSSLQARCNSLALIAQHLSGKELYESPFTKRAREHGIKAMGGKPDDVTIVLFHIS